MTTNLKEEATHFSCTLALGLNTTEQSASGSRSTFDFVDIRRSDIKAQIDAKDPGSGFWPRFGETELKELSLRTGVDLSTSSYKQALGTLGEHRFFGGFLQKSTFSRSLRSFDWLTVVPDGPWRSVVAFYAQGSSILDTELPCVLY